MTTPTATAPAESAATEASWPHRLARYLILKVLAELRHGHLLIHEGNSTISVGEADLAPVEIQVLDSGFYLRLLLGGSVGAGESYADGDWDTQDLTGLIRIMVTNQEVLDGLDHAVVRSLKQGLEKIMHWRNANTRSGSRKNIAAHYDLSNDFFRTWLDSRMMYSSAIFETPDADLEAASEAKLRTLCELLDLQAGEHLLEIGTGWGGLAIYAAEHYDVSVTTTTISQEQYSEAVNRIETRGLSDRIQVLLQDYRDLQGRFDKIVSVEMVEAVGDEFVDGYFQKVESLLKPSGRFVMQAITIIDQRYESALREVDFIKKHIFPGSFIPSVTRLCGAAASTSSLRLVHLRDIGLDYARTLRCWSERFAHAGDSLASHGFDRRFQRLWQFYFSYCEGGFLERAISDVHLAFDTFPPPMRNHAVNKAKAI